MARLDRWQSHGHISHDQEYSARHERAKGWQYHHDLISSCAATVSPISHSVCRSKGRHPDLTQVLAAQTGSYGVRVNCIAPETILTERNDARIPDAQKKSLLDMHPIKRLGKPEDVASAALFLASEDAGWISGVILDVAGGSVMV